MSALKLFAVTHQEPRTPDLDQHIAERVGGDNLYPISPTLLVRNAKL